MKKIILISFLFCYSALIKAQASIDTLSCITLGMQMALIDSTYMLCDTLPVGTFHIIIEPTSNNLWQTGKTIKFGTTSIHDTSCGIMTDTLNPYPINNLSAFHFNLPMVTMWPGYGNYYISFWHKYETDSAMDGCWLEFSDDGGLNWYQADSFSNFPSLNYFENGFTCCNFYNIHSSFGSIDSIDNGTRAWSGSSNGWKYVSLWLNQEFPVKPSRHNSINAVRFVFQSDSTNTNKSGWMIDDLNIGYVDVGSAVNDLTLNQFSVYPNPSSEEFTVELPGVETNTSIEVYNTMGALVYKQNDATDCNMVNLSKEANGIYLVNILHDGRVLASQKMMKE